MYDAQKLIISCSIDTQGLQAAESLHHHPGPHAVHCQGLLEDGARQEVWGDCHAL